MGYGGVQVLVKGACRLSQDPSLLRGRVGMLQGGSRTTQCEVCNLTLLQHLLVLPRANQSVSSAARVVLPRCRLHTCLRLQPRLANCLCKLQRARRCCACWDFLPCLHEYSLLCDNVTASTQAK